MNTQQKDMQPCHYADAVYSMDGNAMCITRKDFVDLQQSPSVWPLCPKCKSGDATVSDKDGVELICNLCGEEYCVDHSALYLP